MKHANIAIFIPHLGCPHHCSFCNQRVISGNEAPVSPQEVQGILQRACAQITDPKKREQTEIAFFGGSFTAIGIKPMRAFLEICQPYLGEGGFSGIRISTRPDAITTEILDILAAHRVSAIELGVQSLDDTVLRLNERGHTAADVYRAVKLIRSEAYHFSLGLQMMVGLYGDTEKSLSETAEKIIALRPDTLRIYPTVVLRGTKLDMLLQSGAYQPMDLDSAVKTTARWMERFERAGIRLIKVGLHASKEVEEQLTGGLYHPAFRELCESELARQRVLRLLAPLPAGNYTLFVKNCEVSKVIGQKRKNLLYFASLGYRLRVKGTKDGGFLLERES